MNNIDDYQIITQIYESSNSLVYRARNKTDNQPIVLKILKENYPTPSELTCYQQEYEITRCFNVDNIIKVYDLRRYKNSLVMLLEDFGGHSLKLLISQSPFSLSDFLTIAINIVEGLVAIHSANIIHKDINPNNIIYNPETEQIKIIDFGLATRLSKEIITVYSPHQLEGTLAYISPEQTGRMNRGIDYRSDFYSLGITFYELLTRKLPFETTDQMELIHCHLAQQPPPINHLIPDLPLAMSNIIGKLLAKTPEERYQSAWGIKADLEICLNQLNSLGEITSFPLATQDVAEKFQIPHKLYGRELEVNKLLTIFDEVSQGNTQMLLISGYSGVGKSALVNEIHKPIVRQRGQFIKGKFDQFNRDIPYAAIAQAFRELIHKLLSEPEIILQAWVQKILAVLGSNGQIIIEIIPELEKIIGQQPFIKQLGGTESQNRFNLFFRRFLRIFCKKEHPLVIFIDDLQWADLPSLHLIEQLMLDPDNQYFLLIGAYRDNEVSPTHPLNQTLEKIKQAKVSVSEISLDPLDISHINQLIADTLNCSRKIVQPLAKLVARKTDGNPFFLTQLLYSLYQEKLLVFNRTKTSFNPDENQQGFYSLTSTSSVTQSNGCWQWDIEKIEKMSITDNVVDLMVKKIEKLEQITQQILKLAACIGNYFDLEILSLVNNKSPRETARELQSALNEGLIIPLDNNYKVPLLCNQEDLVNDLSKKFSESSTEIPYKFLHDRVQQAAYSLIQEKLKQEVHLKIGQLLLKNTLPERLEENIFDIVNQLNVGADLLSTQLERNNLSQLNLIAAKKAKKSSAYLSALKYLELALNFLSSDSWECQYNLTLDIYLETIEVQYINTEFDQAEILSSIVLEKAQEFLDKVKVHELKIQSHIAKFQFHSAIEVAIFTLKELNIDIPQHPSQQKIKEEYQSLNLLLKDNPIENLFDLSEMRDPYKLSAIRILLAVTAPAFITNASLYCVITLTAVKLCVTSGNPPEAAGVYIFMGKLLCGMMKDIDSGYQFGQLSLRLLEKFNIQDLKSLVLHYSAGFIRPWKESIHDSNIIPMLQTALNVGLDTGDIEHASYNASAYCLFSLFSGFPLEPMSQTYEQYINLTIKLKQSYTVSYMKNCRKIVINLLNGYQDNYCLVVGNSQEEEQKTLALWTQEKAEWLLFSAYLAKTISYYFFKDYQQAVKSAVEADKNAESSAAYLVMGQHNFYYSLALLGQAHSSEINQSQKALEQVSLNQQKMKKWAKHCPENFQHKYDLVEAEKARILGENWQAQELYEKAIQGAKKYEFIHEEAIAYERAAEFYLAHRREEIGHLYLNNSHHCYIRWGAIAKVQKLEEEYPQHFIRRTNQSQFQKFSSNVLTTGNHGEHLDLITVIKASQAISGEINLENLLQKLMTIVIENAGAQKGCLLLPNINKSEELRTLSIAIYNSEKNTILSPDIPLYQILPETILYYVERTHESVVLDDASLSKNFSQDPYIQSSKRLSILCYPLLNQAQLVGIVYLENKITVGAFTRERIEFLQLLSGQAAVALSNARLYAKVTESEQQLKQFLEAVPVGIGVVDRNGHPYYANQLAKKLLGQGINPETKEEEIVEVDQNYMAGTNELYPDDKLPINKALQGELTKVDDLEIHQEENINIIGRSGDYLLTLINNILDLAKIEAGKMTLNPYDFDLYSCLQEVEDLLHLKANNKGLKLEIKHEQDVPQYINTDETKLRQVLINLINNAIKFTSEGGVFVQVRNQHSDIKDSNLNNDSKSLTNDDYVNITVQDTGVGIAAEELDKLFEAFAQTESGKKSSEGTGLGLAISRKFVQLMGGDITVTSEVGSGTTFSFNIKITKIKADGIKTKPIIRHVIALQPGQPRYKILIVDDHPANRLLLIKLLQSVGFELQEATNGQEAIEKWETWQPHLIFMDMRMPVMDGYEATQHIKGIIKGNATAIVALTASFLEEEKAIVLSAGCDDFIRKPFQESVIFDVISKHLGVEYVYDEEDNTEQKLLNLTPDDLKVMPQEWLERLYHGSRVLDDDLILELIEEIPESNFLLADKLTGLVDTFQIKKIKQIIKLISSINLE